MKDNHLCNQIHQTRIGVQKRIQHDVETSKAKTDLSRRCNSENLEPYREQAVGRLAKTPRQNSRKKEKILQNNNKQIPSKLINKAESENRVQPHVKNPRQLHRNINRHSSQTLLKTSHSYQQRSSRLHLTRHDNGKNPSIQSPDEREQESVNLIT